MNSIFYCSHCKIFTLNLYCPKCNDKTGFFRPPKFSIEDRLEDLKRRALEDIREKRGLL